MRIEHGGDHLDLAVRVEIDQVDDVVGYRSSDLVAEDLLAQRLHRGSGVVHVRRRANPTLGEVDALQERWHDLAEFGEHQIGVGAGLGQWMGSHAQQQRLIRLPGAVDADIRQRGGGKHAADCVESPGLDRRAVREVGVVGVLGLGVAEELLQLRDQCRVRVEHAVHVGDVPGAELRAQQLRIAVVPVAAAKALVVGDVAGRLLEVRHQSTPLEHLGEHVGGLFAREVDAAELGDRVVAVFEEHLVVEFLGASKPDRCVDGLVTLDVEFSHELLQEESTQAQRSS